MERPIELAGDDGLTQPLSITAVIPMHNASGTILRALASVTTQTRPVTRIIVVDDASSDNTVELVEHSGFANLDVVRQPDNRGPGATRNTGVAAAKTEWVAMLDADDVWAPTFIAEVSAAIVQFRADFGSCGGLRMLAYRRQGHPMVSTRLLNTPATYIDLTDDFWRIGVHFAPIHSSSTIVRTSLYKKVGGCPEDVRSGEDISLFAKLWLHGRFAFVNKPLFESIAVGGGLSAGTLTYHDVRLGLQRMAGALATSIRMRKAGSGWFALFFLQRVVRRNMSWAVRNLRRRKLVAQAH